MIPFSNGSQPNLFHGDLEEIQVEFYADKILRPAQHCRFGLRRTLIVAGGEKWPNVVERRRRRPREEERRGDGGLAGSGWAAE